MSNGSEFLVDSDIEDLLDNADPKRAAEETFLEYALQILAYAQDNAPWADRTGEARAGLDVDVSDEGDQLTLTLFHTVDYGIFLETIQSGDYAIIMPTLELFAPTVFAAVGGRVESGFG